MGVKGLYSYINKHCTENGNGIRRPLSYFQNKTIIIDVSIYMYKFKYYVDGGTIIDLFDTLLKYLLSFNIKIILVFDGNMYMENNKKNEINTRKKQKETNAELLMDIVVELENIKKTIDNENDNLILSGLLIKEKQLIDNKKKIERTITQISQNERRELYQHLDLHYKGVVEFLYESSEEADKMISRISRKSKGRVIVMSDDTDMFLYGSPTVAMNYDPKTQSVSVYQLKTILSCLNMNFNEFVQTCVVVGTDYLSPYHDNSPLPKISITQMVMKVKRFKKHAEQYGTCNNYGKDNYYNNFIDFMCFIYWKNVTYDKIKLNKKLWSIFDIFYRI